MRRFFYLFFGFFSFCCTFCFAQSSLSYTRARIDKELGQLAGKIGDDPKQEGILLRLKAESTKLAYDEGILLSGDNLMMLYLSQSRIKEAIEIGNQLKKVALNKKDTKGIISNIYRRNGLALGYLGLDDASLKDLRMAMRYAETIENKDRKLFLLSLCYHNLNIYYTKRQFDDKKYRDSTLLTLNKSLDLAYQIKDDNGFVSNDQKYDHIAFDNMRLGIFYLERPDNSGNLEKAEKHLLECQKIYENKEYKIPPGNKVMMLNQFSWLYLEKKDYKRSIDYADRAMQMEKKYPDPTHRVESFEFLASSYLETGDKEKSKFYMDKYTLLKDSLNLADKANADVAMKQIDAKTSEENKETLIKQWLLMAILVLLGAIVTWILWIRRNKEVRRNYEQIIDRLKNETMTDQDKLPVSQPRNNISNEKEKELLMKLELFEKSEIFIKKDLTIGYLSVKFGTNPRYLSEIIKKSRSQNFNNYINNLRVDHIVHKLYNEPRYREYKISYLAEQCGFASSQVFIIAFKKMNGVTPSYFIQNLKADNAK
ncbi:MAG: AraC family transcriptional regulator [Chryseobacterium sp.]|nr:AraC family transcriptional regulator [Chryseobacterium sp.]